MAKYRTKYIGEIDAEQLDGGNWLVIISSDKQYVLEHELFKQIFELVSDSQIKSPIKE